MEYRLDFFNNFDEFVGSIDFEAFSDEAASSPETGSQRLQEIAEPSFGTERGC